MRVLVIENDLDSAKLLQRSLEAEYYAVDIAIDAEVGVKMAESDEYDLITLNVNLPDSDGIEIVQKIRANRVNSPIIAITEKKSIQTKVDLLNIGCDDFITKPFHFEEVAARIRAILRRRGILSSELIQLGNLTLDPMAHEVKCEGKTLELRNREFDLLEYLLRNEGHVVTRNMVLEHVWDINADAFSNTIEVHITHLRRKLKDTGISIKTVRGIGYKLVLL